MTSYFKIADHVSKSAYFVILRKHNIDLPSSIIFLVYLFTDISTTFICSQIPLPEPISSAFEMARYFPFPLPRYFILYIYQESKILKPIKYKTIFLETTHVYIFKYLFFISEKILKSSKSNHF